MPLEPPDQQHWQAAVGYVELGMFQDANDQLEKIDPFNRAAPEVLAVRLSVYRGLKKWKLMQQIAKRLARRQIEQRRRHGLHPTLPGVRAKTRQRKWAHFSGCVMTLPNTCYDSTCNFRPFYLWNQRVRGIEPPFSGFPS